MFGTVMPCIWLGVIENISVLWCLTHLYCHDTDYRWWKAQTRKNFSSSAHTSVLYYLTTCQRPCLSPCGQLCHRWSITIGGGLLLAKAHRLTDPDKSAVNASSQLNALIGSDRHSGPYASFMPPGPQKSSVGRYVMCVYVYILFVKKRPTFSTCC